MQRTNAACSENGFVSHAKGFGFHANPVNAAAALHLLPLPRKEPRAQQNVRNQKSLYALQKITEGVVISFYMQSTTHDLLQKSKAELWWCTKIDRFDTVSHQQSIYFLLFNEELLWQAQSGLNIL
jgi:hypothetical protein